MKDIRKLVLYLLEGVVLYGGLLFATDNTVFEPLRMNPYSDWYMINTAEELLSGAIVALGLLPAFIAYRKGHSFGVWWAYGTLLFIVAIFHAILIKPDNKILSQE